jgi:hypothetical protein
MADPKGWVARRVLGACLSAILLGLLTVASAQMFLQGGIKEPGTSPGKITSHDVAPDVEALDVWCANCTGSEGLTDAELRAAPVEVTGTVDVGTPHVIVDSAPTTAVTGPLTDAQLRATPVPVSGTVTASGPLTDSQLRATPVPVSGTVTIGTFPDNEPFNVAQLGGTAVVSGGLAGSQSVGGTAGNDAAITQNPVLLGCETIAQGSQPTAATAGNQRRCLASREGALFVQEGSANRFSCFVQAVTVTTQCQAAPAAGLRAYVTGAALSNQAATVQTLDVVFGTGSNCATGTTALTHKFQMGTNATTTSPMAVVLPFTTPLVPTAATALCLRPSAATAFGATLTGFIAP